MQLVAQVPQQLLIFCYLDLFAIDKKDSHCKNSLNLNFGSHVTEALFSAFRHRNSEFLSRSPADSARAPENLFALYNYF